MTCVRRSDVWFTALLMMLVAGIAIAAGCGSSARLDESAAAPSPSPSRQLGEEQVSQRTIERYVLAVGRIYKRMARAHRDIGRCIKVLNEGSASGKSDWASLAERFGENGEIVDRASVQLAALTPPPVLRLLIDMGFVGSAGSMTCAPVRSGCFHRTSVQAAHRATCGSRSNLEIDRQRRECEDYMFETKVELRKHDLPTDYHWLT